MSFIISRLNKDNFWNLAVYFGIVLTVGLAEYNGSVLLLISAFTVTPYILTRFNRVKYLEDGSCVNSQEQNLSDRVPRFILFIIALGVVLNAICKATGLLDFISDMPEEFRAPAFIGCMIFWPFVYLIIKNCPISWLFNADSWADMIKGSFSNSCGSYDSDPTLGHRPMSSSHSHSSSRNDFITSPVYSHMPQNVYHSSHNRRY